MKDFHVLGDYPKLYRWYSERLENPPEVSDHVATLIFNTGRALEHSLEGRLRIWMSAVEHFFNHATDGQRDFLKAERTFQECDVDFFVLASELAETALKTAKGPTFQSLMQQIADKSQLSVFRFFSAWTALNTGELDLCIDECEKITDPFACVYTLQGQAFLETGSVDEAIDALVLAIDLSPQEVMAHFQLAKAYFTKDEFEKAWLCLEKCKALMPDHPEVQTFMAMIALRIDDTASRAGKLQQILPELLVLLESDQENIDLLFLTIDATFLVEDKNAMGTILETVSWEKLRKQPKFMSQIATILRELDKKNWRDISLALLTKLTSDLKTA